MNPSVPQVQIRPVGNTTSEETARKLSNSNQHVNKV